MFPRKARLLLVLLAFLVERQSPEPTTAEDCTSISVPPDSLGLDSFYEKYCPAGGLPVVSSGEVPDAPLR